ncbi:MAG: hypothetical protein ACRDYV_02100, partial [Acidimicrobiia bacterium]
GASLLVEVAAPAAQYRFSHALVRATLYDELTAARRVALHRRVGEAIEALYGDALDDQLPALAHHWSQAAAPAADVIRAVDYSARAGDRALAQLAKDEALGYYTQALELLEVSGGPRSDARRLELLISLGEAQRRSGDATHRTTLLDAGRLAREQDDAPAMARAALANTRGSFSQLGVVDREKVAALEATLAALGNEEPALRARLLAILACELLWSEDAGRRQSLHNEALTLARRHADPLALGSVLLMRWATLWKPHSAQERLDIATEVRAIAEATGDPNLRFWGLWRSSLAILELGDADESHALWRAAQDQADELGQPFPRYCVIYSEVAAAILAARLDEAEQRAGEVLAFGTDTGQTDSHILHAVQLAGIRYEQGRLPELESLLAGMVDTLPGVPFFRAALSLAYCEAGRWDEARATHAPLAGRDPAAVAGDDWFALPTTALLATLAVDLGAEEDAAALARTIAPYAHQLVSYPIWFGAFSHHLARLATLLGYPSEAERWFLDAASTHQRVGAPAWLARTRLECARMLLGRNGPGDADRARDMLLSALDDARRLGLAGVERQAVALLT